MRRPVVVGAVLGLGPVLAIGVYAIGRGAFWGESVDPVAIILGVACVVLVGAALRRGFRNGWKP